MFGKKPCPSCSKKIEGKYSFCPYCGNPVGKSADEYGMLGTNDIMQQNSGLFDSFFSGMGSGMLNKMLGSTMKMLEKELEKEMKSQKKGGDSKEFSNPQRTNFEIIINGKRVNPENIRFSQRIIPHSGKAQKAAKPLKKSASMSAESIKKMSKMPRQEPSTSIRRFSNKVIYEIEIPGVKSIEDISITKLENSIEVKALANDKAYSKLIPINLPILNYELSDGKLTLELDAKN